MFGYKPVLGLTDFPITNLIINGNFVNGTTGWTTINGTLSVVEGKGNYKVTSATTACRIDYGSVTTSTGNKIYMQALFMLPRNGRGTFRFGDVYKDHDLSANMETLLSTIIIADGVNNAPRFYFNRSGTLAINDVCTIGNIMVIDLTSTFGAGNEPTKEEMDKLLTYFPNSWFDGTVNLADYKWFMIYLLNQIRDLKTAVVGIGGTV